MVTRLLRATNGQAIVPWSKNDLRKNPYLFVRIGIFSKIEAVSNYLFYLPGLVVYAYFQQPYFPAGYCS